ncbi:FRG domain-containing protein [Neptuniibacter sp. QD72_48]|uniref:FRG domain-containing protein n=1 Tax=unclassified Neptuniibacter TaxID=2630693 RepID=UPI0039F510D8
MITTFDVNNFCDYVRAVQEINERVSCHESELWYRGVSDQSYELLSGIQWRQVEEIKHEGMIDEFLTSSPLYDSTVKTLGAFEQYALMQHYGLPTRLLDWSISPLIALFFALEKDEENENRVVWCMNHLQLNNINTGSEQSIFTHSVSDEKQFDLSSYLPKTLSNVTAKTGKNAIAIKMQFTNKRISSQQGTFTLHGHNSKKIDDYFVDGNCKEIFKIEINGSEARRELMETLLKIGIAEDTVYQDLNSLSKRILREYTPE